MNSYILPCLSCITVVVGIVQRVDRSVRCNVTLLSSTKQVCCYLLCHLYASACTGILCLTLIFLVNRSLS